MSHNQSRSAIREEDAEELGLNNVDNNQNELSCITLEFDLP